ncbi:MAG: RNA-binding S4 domain-containing protein [Sulfitobacter sp.]
MAQTPPVEKLRLDKWLWHARFFKTRSLAATRVSAGDVRVNGDRVEKRATSVAAGDVLTFAQGHEVRVIRIDAIGQRRGPATEAQKLYSDLTPPKATTPEKIPENPAFEGKGRPTKRDRRTLDLSKARYLE